MPFSKKDEVIQASRLGPDTTTDMEALFSWKHGQTLWGTQAKAHPGMKRYINDINKAWGKSQSDFKDVYIDTFKSVSEQLSKK